jgi:hypothetical protein
MIQSVKLLQNMVSNRTPPYTLHNYSILIHTGRGGKGVKLNQREGEKGRGATGKSTDHKAELKIPT